ncbi:MAG: ribosomal protein S18-alanine N-acetyltransferase [Dehalococcoidia bacterium]|nr:ribosomal protein S18-alanine N-acetyltransferase [Dehalococcoidia bacterium]
MDCIVRPMALEDLPQVVEIEKGSFPQPWSRDLFHHELTANHISRYMVVCQEQIILGYIGVWLIVGEIHITTFAVHQNHRRKGLGELLIITAIDLALEHGATLVTLEVSEMNLGARAMYKKCGFVDVGRRRHYYSETNEDAILMSAEDITSAAFQEKFQQLKTANVEKMKQEVSG